MRGLHSFSALIFQTTAVTPIIANRLIAVLAFQFGGLVYQPPAGDQTCLGYLDEYAFEDMFDCIFDAKVGTEIEALRATLVRLT